MRGLSVRQPWAYAIAHAGKPVENRVWKPTYRGPIAVHATLGHYSKRDFADHARHIARLSGTSVAEVTAGASVRGAIVAVADLVDVCSAAAGHPATVCNCGPWAVAGQHHLRLTNVHAIADPVEATGALSFWTVPDEVEAAVRAQLGQEAAL